jgi:signal transduction histidine kinase/phage shock protein PspC (stress-responsive transcriptional regulator)
VAAAVTTPKGGVQPRVLRRDREQRWLGGVCAGIARRFGIDVALVRLAFVVATAAGGLGVAAYALGWLVIPAGDAQPGARRRPAGRGAFEVAVGTGLLLLSVLLTFRALGLWFSDAIVWPLVLVASGGVLLWRASQEREPRPTKRPPGAVLSQAAQPPPVPATPTAPVGAAEPGPGLRDALRGAGETLAGAARHGRTALAEAGVDGQRAWRGVAGAVLVVAAGVAFLQATGALGAARDVLLAAIAVAVVLGVILAPWIVRLVRSLGAERAERARSEERAELAAHLHDSVLQTLALVQRRAADPGEVAALARRQERELRAWLAGRPAPGAVARVAPALEAAAADVEERHGVPVEVVTVGDRDLDEQARTVVAAAREAMTNAAKFGAGSPVDVYAEADDRRLHVFVRDRGPGFDPDAVPTDRRGVRESVIGRMERHGGRATITSSPGAGTEVELMVEREGR